jgi:hypothetical protein
VVETVSSLFPNLHNRDQQATGLIKQSKIGTKSSSSWSWVRMCAKNTQVLRPLRHDFECMFLLIYNPRWIKYFLRTQLNNWNLKHDYKHLKLTKSSLIIKILTGIITKTSFVLVFNTLWKWQTPLRMLCRYELFNYNHLRWRKKGNCKWIRLCSLITDQLILSSSKLIVLKENRIGMIGWFHCASWRAYIEYKGHGGQDTSRYI